MSENKFDELNKGRNKRYTRKKDHRFQKDDYGDGDSSLKFRNEKKRKKVNWKQYLKNDDDE